MNLIHRLVGRRVLQSFWSRLILFPFLATPAFAQLDMDFSPRTFQGTPLVASVQADSTQPGGPMIFRNYRFDSEGRLLQIEQGSETLGVTLEVGFESDAEGRPVQVSAVFMGNLGWIETYAYDDAGRIESWTKLNPRTQVETVSRRHVYDEEGRQVKTVFVQAGRTPEETTRTFDASNRVLQEETTSDGKMTRRIDFEYDASGCLVKQVTLLGRGPVEVREWEHGKDCRPDRLKIRTFAGKITTVTMTYDGKGNLLTESTLREGKPAPTVQRWTYEFPKPASDSAVKEDGKTE